MKPSNITAFLIGFALIVILVVTCSGCASSGLYYMSDRWCAEHPDASKARCIRG